MKTRKLADEDRRAVDLLLDNSATAGHPMTRVSRMVSPGRLTAAKQLLATLGEMPEVELPGDLVSRTLARIDRSTGAGVPLPETVRATMHMRPS